MGFCLEKLACSIIVAALSALRDYSSDRLGLPVKEIILSIWFKVELPGKIGFPISISAKIQPMLQTSADLPYELDPRRTSGALYHLVATS
jgi:hypothetical protein